MSSIFLNNENKCPNYGYYTSESKNFKNASQANIKEFLLKLSSWILCSKISYSSEYPIPKNYGGQLNNGSKAVTLTAPGQGWDCPSLL